MIESQKSTQDLAEQVQRIWRKTRPRLMQLHDRTNQAEAKAREAANRCRGASEHLQGMGVPCDQADSLAMYEWVYLPDIDERDELGAELLSTPSVG
jgi:hypothetical protein